MAAKRPARPPAVGNQTLSPRRHFGQSPSVAWMSVSAATAAVSARRIRGPRLRRSTRGAARIAARSSSSKPPSGPTSRPTPFSAPTSPSASRALACGASSSQKTMRRSGGQSASAFSSLSGATTSGDPDHAALLAGFDRVGAQTLEVDARGLGAPGDERHEPPRPHLDRLLRHIVEAGVLERREEIVDVRRRLLRPRSRGRRRATRFCAKSPRARLRIRRRGH